MLGGHLVEAGARRICFLVHRRCAASVRLRSSGVLSAAGDKPGVRAWVLCAEPDESTEIRKLLSKEKPDAIVCGNDKTAARLRQTLARLGKRVPEDVMLAGFDDVQIAFIMTPQLTTVHQPCEDIAEAAFSALLERMRRPNIPPREIFLPARLVVRESTRGRNSRERQPM